MKENDLLGKVKPPHQGQMKGTVYTEAGFLNFVILETEEVVFL